MNKLKGTSIYLSGAIDRVADHGRGWRESFVKKISHLQLNILDPTNKPNDLLSETEKEKNLAQRLKDDKQWNQLHNFAKFIRRVDLRMCDLCDFIVAYIDPDVHLFGTIDEVVTVERQRKPVFLIIKGGKQRASLWAFALTKPEHIFNDEDECIDYLNKLSDGRIKLDNKWVLINNKGE